ncbi:MAG: hypothetical protein L6Q80_12150 [Dehalococcoidia bacterium]|nr:hypothetical protein [Dehalococcoidia bacterium]
MREPWNVQTEPVPWTLLFAVCDELAEGANERCTGGHDAGRGSKAASGLSLRRDGFPLPIA